MTINSKISRKSSGKSEISKIIRNTKSNNIINEKSNVKIQQMKKINSQNMQIKID